MSKRNRSFTYILPMLGNEVLDMEGFISDTYLKDINNPTNNRRLYLKLDFDGSDSYTRFESQLEWSIYYVDKYDVNKNTTIVIFDIPEIYHNGYDLILEGKYSQISEYLKEDIIEYHEFTDFSFVYGALYRKEFAYEIVEKRINKGLEEDHWTYIPREQEIGILIDEESEIFKKKSKNVINE